MNNLKITIPLTLVIVFALLAFTSCMEDPVQEEQELISSESLAPLSLDSTVISRGGIIDQSLLDTIYVQWEPWVLNSRKAEIRAEYSDINGEIYLYTYSICLLDNTAERWEILWNPLNPPKDRTPDPLVILSDHDDEMKNDNPFPFQILCP